MVKKTVFYSLIIVSALSLSMIFTCCDKENENPFSEPTPSSSVEKGNYQGGDNNPKVQCLNVDIDGCYCNIDATHFKVRWSFEKSTNIGQYVSVYIKPDSHGTPLKTYTVLAGIVTPGIGTVITPPTHGPNQGVGNFTIPPGNYAAGTVILEVEIYHTAVANEALRPHMRFYSNNGNYNFINNPVNPVGEGQLCTNCNPDPCSGNQTPNVDFTFSPSSPITEGDTVVFTNLSTDDGKIQVMTHNWEFGDGTGNSTVKDPSHTFNAVGVFTVTLTEYDGCESPNMKHSIEVRSKCFGNHPPIGGFSFSPTQSKRGETVTFSDQSTDIDGNITSYLWDFGDGTGNSTVQNPTYIYNSVGTFTITETVKDTCGESSTVKKTITVKNQPPLVSLGVNPDKSCLSGGEFTFTAIASDPDGDPLVFSWKVNGLATAETTNELKVKPSKAGKYTAEITVNDGYDSASATTYAIAEDCCSAFELKLTTDKAEYLANGYEIGVANTEIYQNGALYSKPTNIVFSIDNGNWTTGIYGNYQRNFESGTPGNATITVTTPNLCKLSSTTTVNFIWFGECLSYDTWLKSESSRLSAWVYGFIQPCPAGSLPGIIFRGYEFYRSDSSGHEIQINATQYSPGVYRDTQTLDRNGVYYYRAIALYDYKGKIIRVPAGGPVQAQVR
ncbi:MAG: PKD domain-containing protein [Candidatus Nanoarchaeia archaeon]|nr:PKD domain-containing protein [Candidatus Nanoarchaeia archaeon]